jgi:hypothetical protein
MAFTIKQGDTLPNLPFQFFKPDKVTPLDLTNITTVSIVIRTKDTLTLLFKKPCTISSAVDGKGYYDWDTGDTDSVGAFQYEFEIHWASGDIQTIPVDTYFDLVVIDDIG